MEVVEYSKLDEGEDLRLMVKLIDEFGAETIIKALKSMQEEKDADVVISTAHRSKGREWDHVTLAADFPTESKCGDPERKLLYVAVTRAKKTLDVSQCPFFTGNDSLDVSDVIANQPKPSDDDLESIVPPAPSTPTQNDEFTWNRIKDDDTWGVRGPKGFKGQTVTVVRKNGSTSQKTLKDVVYENGDSCLYRI
jgi:ATP-dependent exoDNAse (exonuclease V) beta subunit